MSAETQGTRSRTCGFKSLGHIIDDLSSLSPELSLYATCIPAAAAVATAVVAVATGVAVAVAAAVQKQ